ncbi:MAG: tRNA (adenosine(37)-N6)-threonylcarbamoyltransferase complex transferase subunit TsaD [Christensenellales bacterium]
MELKDKENIVILSIESSCDETAAAVVKNGRTVLSSVIATQIDIHRRFGGVVPEIASRNHVLSIESVVDEAMKKANVTHDDIDAIAVTYGAGLLGALLVGVSYAKGLAYVWGKPLFAVSHVKGHIAANYIDSDLKPPYLCMLCSGGHTAVLEVKDYCDSRLLAATRDDAAGEAFDKVARILSLPYPGGPEIEKLAKEGEPVFEFPKPKYKGKEVYFSYSGLKTAVINFVHNAEQRQEKIDGANLACSFQKAAVEQMTDAVEILQKRTGLNKIAIAGGVSANGYLREKFKTIFDKTGVSVYYPQLKYCTDNAAMIGAACYFMIKNDEKPAELSLDAKADVPL